MVSAKLLSDVSHRLCCAKSADMSAMEKPFGDINVIFTGDFGQLRPVGEQPMFGYKLVQRLTPNVTETLSGQMALHGAYLWRQVTHVVILRENWRARNDAPYVNLLAHVRKGIAWSGTGDMSEEQWGTGDNYSVSDYLTLCSRHVDYLMNIGADELKLFHDAPNIVTWKHIRDAINIRKAKMFAREHKQCLHLYKSKDFSQKKELPLHLQPLCWMLESSITSDALGSLPLCIGMPVVITENLSIARGIVNGSQGTVDYIMYTCDSDGNR